MIRRMSPHNKLHKYTFNMSSSPCRPSCREEVENEDDMDSTIVKLCIIICIFMVQLIELLYVHFVEN